MCDIPPNILGISNGTLCKLGIGLQPEKKKNKTKQQQQQQQQEQTQRQKNKQASKQTNKKQITINKKQTSKIKQQHQQRRPQQNKRAATTKIKYIACLKLLMLSMVSFSISSQTAAVSDFRGYRK